MSFTKGNKHGDAYKAQGLKFAHAATQVKREAQAFVESDKRRSDEKHGYMRVTKARG
jgi:hypothetical protein